MPKQPKKLVGYPARIAGRWVLNDYRGHRLSDRGHKIRCTKIKPGSRGSWIDSKRCTYRFKFKGDWYSCRGYGEGIAANCRRMKRPPKGGE